MNFELRWNKCNTLGGGACARNTQTRPRQRRNIIIIAFCRLPAAAAAAVSPHQKTNDDDVSETTTSPTANVISFETYYRQARKPSQKRFNRSAASHTSHAHTQARATHTHEHAHMRGGVRTVRVNRLKLHELHAPARTDCLDMYTRAHVERDIVWMDVCVRRHSPVSPCRSAHTVRMNTFSG